MISTATKIQKISNRTCTLLGKAQGHACATMKIFYEKYSTFRKIFSWFNVWRENCHHPDFLRIAESQREKIRFNTVLHSQQYQPLLKQKLYFPTKRTTVPRSVIDWRPLQLIKLCAEPLCSPSRFPIWYPFAKQHLLTLKCTVLAQRVYNLEEEEWICRLLSGFLFFYRKFCGIVILRSMN